VTFIENNTQYSLLAKQILIGTDIIQMKIDARRQNVQCTAVPALHSTDVDNNVYNVA